MIPLEDVKSYLGVTGSDDDLEIQRTIDRLTDAIEREVDWYFRDPRSVSEVRNGNGLTRMFLKQDPHSGTALVVESRSSVGDAWEVVATTDYEVDGRGVYSGSIFAKGLRNYRFTYAEGFDCPPKDVEQLLLEMVGSLWGRASKAADADLPGLGGALTSERIGDYAYTLSSGGGGGGGDGTSIMGGSAEESARWDATLNRWRRKRL